MSNQPLGEVRPLGRVIALSGITFLLYYGYYKWVIQDELRRYNSHSWSGALSILPFLLGVTIPQALRLFDPDVPSWFGWFSLLGVGWIYIVQFKLYNTVNQLYRDAGLQEPLVVWWLFIPGLNLVVGLRQIHFLSRFWAIRRGTTMIDPLAQALPILFASLLLTVTTWLTAAPVLAAPIPAPPVMGALFSFSGSRPTNLGVQAGQLANCPATPNCVSSQSQDTEHAIAPLHVNTTPEAAFEQLKTVIQAQPRAKIIQEDDRYLYAEFTSAIMGFVDDVEFYLAPSSKVIEVRSASRLGESDLGINRQRIETIRQLFERSQLPT